jgi:hypothetical protein
MRGSHKMSVEGLRRWLRALLVWCVCGIGAWGVGVHAQGIESVLMPGKIIEAHAKLETECSNCHVRLNPAGQSQLCADCHKDVGADIRDKRGYHGRLAASSCRSCHTDHRGRGANIVKLDPAGFDHGKTDFLLQGKHKGVACASCHARGVKHSKAPSDCVSCHRKDDRHKGNLGARCEACHSAASWSQASFDHAKTKFTLENKHAQAKCDACHAGERFAGTPKSCVSCHRKDDAHRGNLGESCDRCHKDAGWKPSGFRHDRDAHFPLRDSHATLSCQSCHTVSPFKVKTATKCVSCHLKDDKHKGALGQKCESCHGERKWSQPRFDHERDTRFALKDKHHEVKCESCHRPGAGKIEWPTRCAACHAEDDQRKGHKGRLGEKCESCHTEQGWSLTKFQHNRDTRYPLVEKHQAVKCTQCHQAPLYREKTPSTCASCHHKDDVHKGNLGASCDKCHSERGWKFTRFEHDKDTSFKLEGAHASVSCKSCHSTRDDEHFTPGKTCQACHVKDDVHFKSFGQACQDCHNAVNWKQVNKKPGDKSWPFKRRPG